MNELTKLQKEVLKQLSKGYSVYKISSNLKRHTSQIYKIANRLVELKYLKVPTVDNSFNWKNSKILEVKKA